MKKIILLFIWLLCGFFAWEVNLAENSNEYVPFAISYKDSSLDCRHQQAFAIIWGEAFGPISLIIALENSGFAEHGLKWTCNVDENVK